nr:MAG TPA: Rho termination factor, N-terminal domain [Caudoviricetes sp.]
MGMLMRRHLNDTEPTPVAEAVEEVANTLEDKTVAEAVEEVANTLEDKTVADLRVIAQQRGLTGISSLTKAELLDLLK